MPSQHALRSPLSPLSPLSTRPPTKSSSRDHPLRRPATPTRLLLLSLSSNRPRRQLEVKNLDGASSPAPSLRTTRTYPKAVVHSDLDPPKGFRKLGRVLSGKTRVSPAAVFLSNVAVRTTIAGDVVEEGDMVEGYVVGRVIGYGGFSVVREASREGHGSEHRVAAKIIKAQDNGDRARSEKALQKEVELWSRLHHPNLVPFLSLTRQASTPVILCELCAKGTLLDYIAQRQGKVPPLKDYQSQTIFRQMVDAVGYLHNEMGMVHRDIKLDNILLHEDGAWKLGDFGLAEYQERDESEVGQQQQEGQQEDGDVAVAGSLAYTCPEQLKSSRPLCRPSLDIWSLGVVLYALLTGKLPFQDEYEPRLVQRILTGAFEEPVKVSRVAKDLLTNMLALKPKERWTIDQVKAGSWCTANKL